MQFRHSLWRNCIEHTSLIFSKIKDKAERAFYLEKAQTEAWSRSILEKKLDLICMPITNSFKATLIKR
jgi:predicted nuclease of restriction endonuclease-like (RecB) superfamily